MVRLWIVHERSTFHNSNVYVINGEIVLIVINSNMDICLSSYKLHGIFLIQVSGCSLSAVSYHRRLHGHCIVCSICIT